ncbi:hypothetical protein C0993_003007, partial [Termitomyces sp. T159_Od127]
SNLCTHAKSCLGPTDKPVTVLDDMNDLITPPSQQDSAPSVPATQGILPAQQPIAPRFRPGLLHPDASVDPVYASDWAAAPIEGTN